jgi:hypothetical protein
VLTETQAAFATSSEPFPAFVGGFGSGKTAAAMARAMALKAHFKDCSVAYYLPTFPLVEDIAFQRFPELCERKGWAFKIRRGASPAVVFPGAGAILFRTMENPDRIVGYEVAHSIIDELDTLPIDKARNVWNKVIARNRQKCPMRNTVAVATTPEGFRFVHEMWVKKAKPGYVLFRARTMDNAAHLPLDYIENLSNTYSPQLLQAYLDGQFVNLTAGSVYPGFDRTKNASAEVVRPPVDGVGEAVHIGMDFNVMHGAAVTHVLRGDEPHAVEEFTEVFDTPAMVRLLKARYKDKGHPVVIYPDASGNSRKSNDASESDLSLLRAAGFRLCVNGKNPAVKDRVLSMNGMIDPDKDGKRRYRVNVEQCPAYVEALEKQPYDKNGEPDKAGGWDHVVDAGGYFIVYRYPLVRRGASTVSELRL